MIRVFALANPLVVEGDHLCVDGIPILVDPDDSPILLFCVDQRASGQSYSLREGHSASIGLWARPGHQSLLVAVNASWREASGALDPGSAGNRDCQLQDRSGGGSTSTVTAQQLQEQGIALVLPPWGVQVYRLIVQK